MPERGVARQVLHAGPASDQQVGLDTILLQDGDQRQ